MTDRERIRELEKRLAAIAPAVEDHGRKLDRVVPAMSSVISRVSDVEDRPAGGGMVALPPQQVNTGTGFAGAGSILAIEQSGWGTDGVDADLEWNPTAVLSDGFTGSSAGISPTEPGTYLIILSIYATSPDGPSVLAWLTVDGAAQPLKMKLDIEDELNPDNDGFDSGTIHVVMPLDAGAVVGVTMAQQGGAGDTEIAAGAAQLTLVKLS